MNESGLNAETLFSIGGFILTDTAITSIVISLMLGVTAIILSHILLHKSIRCQIAAEGIVLAIENAVADVVPKDIVRRILPFVGTLWIFVLTANLAGLVPGIHSPTRDLSITSALAFMVFISTHWYGIKIKGWRSYLKHYADPNIMLLPFNIISEITRSVALAIRLFGNMISLEIAALLVLLIAGFLVPIPILMLHIVEAVVQAYIFGMLSLIYIAGALEDPQ